jgi:magnesium transporter
MRIDAPMAGDPNPPRRFEQQLTRRALLRDADLTPRDLRRIDPSLLQTNNTPALLVKDRTIMVNLGVRVIIRPDHALLFEPDTGSAQRFLAAVNSRHEAEAATDSFPAGTHKPAGKDAHDAVVASTALDDDLDATPGGAGGTPIPFELEMVEAALQETMSQLYAKLEFCEQRCRSVSAQLRSSINPAVLEELRLSKQSLVALDSRAGAVRQVLLDTLDDDDDIADFTISSEATDPEEKEDEEEEVENLIEYYLQQTETVHNAAEQLLENTRDLEESISVSLSSRRYEVSKLELTLSIATFAAALGALVTGIFGMNLRSCLEMSVTAFYLTCALIVAGIGGIFSAIMRFARRQKIL